MLFRSIRGPLKTGSLRARISLAVLIGAVSGTTHAVVQPFIPERALVRLREGVAQRVDPDRSHLRKEWWDEPEDTGSHDHDLTPEDHRLALETVDAEHQASLVDFYDRLMRSDIKIREWDFADATAPKRDGGERSKEQFEEWMMERSGLPPVAVTLLASYLTAYQDSDPATRRAMTRVAPPEVLSAFHQGKVGSRT